MKRNIFINGLIYLNINSYRLPKILIALILLGNILHANAQRFDSAYHDLDFNADSLMRIYGKHKQILKEFELPSLIALSYFPELIDARIKFKSESINSTGVTTVNFISIFKKVNKQYIICINNNIRKTGILLDQAPFDAQVAVIAHELAHVMDFKRRSFFGMALWGVRYLFVKQRARIEKRADELVIRRGLGTQLYLWADFVLHYSTVRKHYLKIKQTRYLLPDEIKKYITN